MPEARFEDMPRREGSVDERLARLERSVQILYKTVEGIQQLFIRAGEYQGKPRGRLPG